MCVVKYFLVQLLITSPLCSRYRTIKPVLLYRCLHLVFQLSTTFPFHLNQKETRGGQDRPTSPYPCPRPFFGRGDGW
ncbi:hypothetical protein BX600DRAFT_80323 [Xylariales sp. PMI_506]|nr:hypothetical protein BX600DRAFT_80323 [Xylariales sp. PMI_506]